MKERVVFIKENQRVERQEQLKKEVLEKMFIARTHWEVKRECSPTVNGAKLNSRTGKYTVTLKYYEESRIPKDCLSDAERFDSIEINNAGVAKKVRRKINTYDTILSEEDIQGHCIEIILKAIDKFKLPKDAIKGKEKNLLYGYIFRLIDTELQKKIDKETETIDIIIDKERWILSPTLMSSSDEIIEDDEGNLYSRIETVGNEQNLFSKQKGYRKTKTYENILDSIGDKLSDKQKELLHIISYTIDGANPAGNNVEVGRILKQQDIKEGRKIRTSEEAYRVYVSRETKKIVNIIKENMNIGNISRLEKLENLKEDIENLLESPTELNIITYATENIDKHYIDNIIYSLDIELRKYFILNFATELEEYKINKIDDNKTKKVCSEIVSGLYEHIDLIEQEIKNINVIDLIGRGKDSEGYKKPILENSDIKYYVFIDKYKELKKIKNIEKLGQQEIKVEYTRKYIDYKVEYYNVFYLGEYKELKIERKLNYGKINQLGVISK